jgi:hypothetical protein
MEVRKDRPRTNYFGIAAKHEEGLLCRMYSSKLMVDNGDEKSE